jgi:hypothetical protein
MQIHAHALILMSVRIVTAVAEIIFVRTNLVLSIVWIPVLLILMAVGPHGLSAVHHVRVVQEHVPARIQHLMVMGYLALVIPRKLATLKIAILSSMVVGVNGQPALAVVAVDLKHDYAIIQLQRMVEHSAQD